MNKTSSRTGSWGAAERGVMLMEVTVAMGVAVFVAMLVMKGSLLALSGNQWTIMQTLTDAYLTRETALSNRIPMAALTAPNSAWPDAGADNPPHSVQTVTLGILPGGQVVQAQLTRFRLNETQTENADTSIAVWQVVSILSYTAGDKPYVKSRSTLRTL